VPCPPTPDRDPDSFPTFPAHRDRRPSDPRDEPRPLPERPRLPSTPLELHYRLAVSGTGHGGIRGKQRNHPDPAVLLRQAAGLLDVGQFQSDDPDELRRRAAEIRVATAHALQLEDAALELQAAEEDAAIVRRRVQRSEKAILRKADLEARRSTGGLYAGERRSPNRPTHVEVDEQAWATLKAQAARRRQTMAKLVGDLVAATAAGLPPERKSERRTERGRKGVQAAGGRGRRASRYARLFLPDDETWLRFRASAADASTSIARAVGLVVEHEAHRLGWRPEGEK
jgi:hypothetical protein